jgi:uncharacterized repeat protein (TIGR02543 family)
LNQNSLNLTAGNTATLTATVQPANASNKNVSWTSSNTGVATVTNGAVNTLTNGTAIITVTTADGGYTAFCAVTVGTSPGGNGGTLTINNLPNDVSYAVGVYNHSGAISDILEWATVATNIIAVGSGTASSSMTLYAANTVTGFTGTGSYMVALYTTSVPITVVYKTGVSFTNGNATVDYAEMTDLLGNAPGTDPGTGGGLTSDIDSTLEGTSWKDNVTGSIITVSFTSNSVTWGGTAGNQLNATTSALQGTGYDFVWIAKNGVISYKYSYMGNTPQEITVYTYTLSGNTLELGASGVTIATLISTNGSGTGGGNQDSIVEMVYVSGGSFQMGKELGTAGSGDTTPVHMVTLTGFYMGKYQVTQEQYEAVMGTNPSNSSSNPASGEVQEKRPVEKVTWYDAVEFCNKLSEREGLQTVYTISGRTPSTGYPITSATVTADWGKNGYRLPTEAQWEYAAKGGSTPGNYTYAGSNTIGDVAWYSGNSGSKTHEVGKLAPNGLGLCDMSGNVWEWCWDWYGGYEDKDQTDPVGAATDGYRVMRGGNWYDSAEAARLVIRGSYNPSIGESNNGFRLVRMGTGEIVTPNTHLVTFNTDGGSTVSPVTVTSGNKISAPTAPTKSGYTFDNWYKDSGLTTLWNFNTDTVTSNITLYAKWNINETPPTVIPSAGYFTDTDYAQNKIGGTISWQPPSDTGGISGYRIYWGQSQTQKLSGNTTVIYETNGPATAAQNVTNDTSLPSGAAWFLVYSYNQYGDSASCLAVSIVDAIPISGSFGVFTVSGNGSVSYSANQLTIRSAGDYTISGTSTNDRIIVATGLKNVNVTLSGVSINVSSIDNACAFDITGAVVNVTLTGTNVLKSGRNRAGLKVPDGATLVITANSTGTLEAVGGNGSNGSNAYGSNSAGGARGGGAGIGGDAGSYSDIGHCGTISLLGGNITATGGGTGTWGSYKIQQTDYYDSANGGTGGGGAGIGGGGGQGGYSGYQYPQSGIYKYTDAGDGYNGGSGGTITINTANVVINATGGGGSANKGASVGGGAGGRGGSVTSNQSRPGRGGNGGAASGTGPGPSGSNGNGINGGDPGLGAELSY